MNNNPTSEARSFFWVTLVIIAGVLLVGLPAASVGFTSFQSFRNANRVDTILETLQAGDYEKAVELLSSDCYLDSDQIAELLGDAAIDDYSVSLFGSGFGTSRGAITFDDGTVLNYEFVIESEGICGPELWPHED